MMPLGVSEKFLRTNSVSLASLDLAGAEGIDQHADGLGDADGVGELDFAACRRGLRRRCSWRCSAPYKQPSGRPWSDPCRENAPPP